MNEQHISFAYQARYYTLPVPEQPAKKRWLACHGYGQLARFFLRHFSSLPAEGVEVIAPEGLAQFYLAGTEGRVGASWMTKENRELAITNYLNFIDAVVQAQPHAAPLTLFGFSQGCATVCRYLMHTQTPVDTLILWAGIFPPDLNLEMSKEKLQHCKITLVWGENDPYFSPERLAEQQSWLDALGLSYRLLHFPGTHTLDTAVLQSLTVG